MKRVLFVCTSNAARSQMAEALLRLLGKDEYEVMSTELKPTFEVHPLRYGVTAEAWD